jgi:hypothetical protein
MNVAYDHRVGIASSQDRGASICCYTTGKCGPTFACGGVKALMAFSKNEIGGKFPKLRSSLKIDEIP